MAKVSENNAQQIRELLNRLELAAYGDMGSKHHQLPDVQLFRIMHDNCLYCRIILNFNFKMGRWKCLFLICCMIVRVT